MSSLPIHPAIVHLPLALAPLVPIVALGAAVAVHRGKLPRWLWGAVLGLQIALVGAGAVAMQTGEHEATARVGTHAAPAGRSHHAKGTPRSRADHLLCPPLVGTLRS